MIFHKPSSWVSALSAAWVRRSAGASRAKACMSGWPAERRASWRPRPAGIVRDGGQATPIVADATQEDQVAALFERVASAGSPLEVVVFNAGNNRRLDLLATSAREFESYWRVGCLGGFIVGREAAKRLVSQGHGSLLFTGASASLRGRPGYAHFAAAKAGLRVLAQAMAREFGPRGVHVGHVVIDGGIDGERLRSALPQLAAERGDDGLLQLEAIAEAYWQLHRQPRSAWTFELDLRPFKEPF